MNATRTIDSRVSAWRAATPGTAHRNHLNNAGAGLMPSSVVEAMIDHVKLEAEIGGYEAADARAAAIANTYDAVATLIGAAPQNIARGARASRWPRHCASASTRSTAFARSILAAVRVRSCRLKYPAGTHRIP